MSAIIRVQVNFQGVSLKPEDIFVNRWHFQVETTPPSPTTLAAINTALQTLYNIASTSYAGKAITNAVVTKFYNMADPEPRRPIFTSGFGIGTLPTTATLPNECSMVLSFQANGVSGIPQARRRNRVYLPPMIVAALASPDGQYWANATVTGMSNGMAALLSASDAAADWMWIVRSEKTSDTAPVATGWVDNAVDIQRRRGLGATFRDPFP